MNKKIVLILSLVLNLVLIIILASVVAFLYKAGSFKEQASGKKAEVVEDLSPRVPKPIQLEWMSDKDKASFNIATTSDNRIQVLERDNNGNITAYKIIRGDSDILKSY